MAVEDGEERIGRTGDVRTSDQVAVRGGREETIDVVESCGR